MIQKYEGCDPEVQDMLEMDILVEGEAKNEYDEWIEVFCVGYNAVSKYKVITRDVANLQEWRAEEFRLPTQKGPISVTVAEDSRVFIQDDVKDLIFTSKKTRVTVESIDEVTGSTNATDMRFNNHVDADTFIDLVRSAEILNEKRIVLKKSY